MENFVVSARKYRPQTFKDVVGQQAITSTLQRAIANHHLAQALLFCGPRGVGKTTCARILAKEINRDSTPHETTDFSFNIFELDAASNNSVDDIRTLTDQVRIPPQVGHYKVYIIDEVHMLSQAAFNAFLKTLEEPPKHAIFILATTEKHKIIPTILSRCQIFDFKRITVGDAKEYLSYIAEKQGINAEDDALHIIAKKADGAMRDALSIFDRVVSFSGKTLSRKAVVENLSVLDYDTYFEITDAIIAHDIPGLLLRFNEIMVAGFEGYHFIDGLASHFRDLMVCKNETTIALLEVGEHARQSYREQCKNIALPFLIKALEMITTCTLHYKASTNQRLLIELCLMQLASMEIELKKKKEIVPLISTASYRQKPKPGETPLAATKATKTTIIPEESEEPEPIETPTVRYTEASRPIAVKKESRKVSGLSLASIKAKKEHEDHQRNHKISKTNLPEDTLTEEDLKKEWMKYIKVLEDGGKKIMSSILSVTSPKLGTDHTIHIELPNDTMVKEVEKEKKAVLDYLRKQLNNYSITLVITINDTENEKYAVTPLEKYEKLRKKNPLIDILRKEFDLEL